MADERWDAGHRGDYKADHVFDNAGEDDLVSEGGAEDLVSGIDAYFSSLRIMTMMV